MRRTATQPTTTAETVLDTARDKIVPALRTAEGVLVPAVTTALTTAREKGIELLHSDAAHEAHRRGAEMVRAARGETVARAQRGRMFLMFAAGTAAGAAVAMVARRLMTPVPEPYQTSIDLTGGGSMDAGEYVRTIPEVSETPAAARSSS